MSITITLTPALVIGVLYTIITLMVGFAGVVEEMSFRNPNYKLVTISAMLWPLVIINYLTGTYLDIWLIDVWNYIKGKL